MYVNPETITEEDYFTDTINICCKLQENFNSSTSTKTLAWF